MNLKTNRLLTISIAILLFPLFLLSQEVSDSLHPSETATAVLGSAPYRTTAQQTRRDTYVIGNDDRLSINVWKEPDLTQTLPVRSDGKISLPLIGDIQASGKTPHQLEAAIAARLRTYMNDPEVTVMVMQINSQKFNILGRVTKPGAYPLTTTTTVLDAIAEAGGFQDFAKKKKVYILREKPDGGEMRMAFNYTDVIKGKHSEENVRLQAGDTVVVP